MDIENNTAPEQPKQRVAGFWESVARLLGVAIYLPTLWFGALKGIEFAFKHLDSHKATDKKPVKERYTPKPSKPQTEYAKALMELSNESETEVSTQYQEQAFIPLELRETEVSPNREVLRTQAVQPRRTSGGVMKAIPLTAEEVESIERESGKQGYRR